MNQRPGVIQRHADWEPTAYLYAILEQIELLNANLAALHGEQRQPAATTGSSPSPVVASVSPRERAAFSATQADGYYAADEVAQ